MSEIALGAVTFKRMEKLKNLFDSIDSEKISTVYISDTGESVDNKKVYDREYPYDIKIFDMEYDAGLGAGREKIVKNLEEDYMLLVDDDMQMPSGLDILYKQMLSRPDIGGICGLFTEKDRIYTSCVDIFDEGGTCHLEVREDKPIETVDGYPFVQFDFIANAALFRKECLKDYCWDPNYIIGREHADFYVGHKRQTDWNFALSPSVYFPHFPGGDEDFMSNRHSERKNTRSEEYFLDKWGFESVERTNYNWLDTYDPEVGDIPPHSLYTLGKYKYKKEGIPAIAVSGYRILRKRLREYITF
jgi:hypothetical protein